MSVILGLLVRMIEANLPRVMFRYLAQKRGLGLEISIKTEM